MKGLSSKNSENLEVSVVIATFNSEKTLSIVLDALSKQTIDRDKLEILLVDGGSKDKTINIGKKYGAKIINNPQTEPVNAKLLGYKNAKGKYIAYLDHDEVIDNPKSLELKLSIFRQNPKIKAVIGSGYKSPKGYPFINDYVNEFGDPFSFFIYRLSKGADFFIKQMLLRYKHVSSNPNSIVFDFKNVKDLPIIELCAAGSMIDGDFVKEKFPETLKRKELIPHFFYLILPYSLIAISKNDSLVHYSSDNLQKYFNKIKWRVKNNIYHKKTMGESGFYGRMNYLSYYGRLKRFLFIPYAFSLIFPLIDSIYLMATRKKIPYIIHLPLCLYTAYLILAHSLLNLFGQKQLLRSYDETKLIKNS